MENHICEYANCKCACICAENRSVMGVGASQVYIEDKTPNQTQEYQFAAKHHRQPNSSKNSKHILKKKDKTTMILNGKKNEKQTH